MPVPFGFNRNPSLKQIRRWELRGEWVEFSEGRLFCVFSIFVGEKHDLAFDSVNPPSLH